MAYGKIPENLLSLAAGVGNEVWDRRAFVQCAGSWVCPWFALRQQGMAGVKRSAGWAAPACLQQAIGNRLVQATTPGPLAEVQALWPDGASFPIRP